MALVTDSNKQNIDITASAIFAGMVLWFFYSRNGGKFSRSEWIMTAIAAVLGYIVFSQITAGLVEAGAKPGDVTLPPDPYGTDEDFDPVSYTNNIKAAIDVSAMPWDGDYMPEAYTALNNLSNTELATVYNDWKDRYYASYDNQTLTAAIESNTIYWYIGNGSDTDAVRDALVERLKSNGLN